MTTQAKHEFSINHLKAGDCLAERLYFEELIENLPVGSSGRAFHITCRLVPGSQPIDAVLKILSSDPNPKDCEAFEKEFNNERKVLCSLDMPGISRVLGYGFINVRDPYKGGLRTAPFICMTFERGQMLADLVQPVQPNQMKINPLLLVDSLMQCLDTVKRFHEKGVVHLDLHLGNLLLDVRYSGYYWRAHATTIIDFGKCYASFSELIPEATPAFGLMTEHQKTVLLRNKGCYTEVFLKSVEARLSDLNCLAVQFDEIAQSVNWREKKSNVYFVLQMALEILKRTKSDIDPATRINLALKDLNTVQMQENLFPAVKIRTFSSRSAEVPKEIMRLVDTPSFQRQRKVLQLGMTQHVYPGATHTRFVHSLGVVDTANRYVHVLKHKVHTFARDYSPTDHVVLLAYALLHDVGHYPFAHYLEEVPVGDIPTHLRQYVDHESLGALRYSGSNQQCLDTKLVAALSSLRITPNGTDFQRVLGEPGSRTLWGQIIDGPLDADKLDYLVRDGKACDVPYAEAIDTERLIEALVAVRGSDGVVELGISGKAVAPASELLIARFHMYSEVYFHKVCRSIAACIKKAFWLVATKTDLSAEEFLDAALTLQDDAFLTWLGDRLDRLPNYTERFAANSLIRASLISGERKLYKRIATLHDAYRNDSRPTYADALKASSKLGMVGMAAIEQEFAIRLMTDFKVSASIFGLIIDIPPLGKDIRLPYVQDSRDQSRFARLNEVSPPCTGIPESLKRTRKIRMFAEPQLYEAISQKCSLEELERLLVTCINKIAKP